MALDPNLENINITDFSGDRIHIPGAGSQVFFRPKAKWEPCDCEKNLQRGRRCIKEETRCIDVIRNCPIGSCSDTTAAFLKTSLSERPSPARTTPFVSVTSPRYVTTTPSGSSVQKSRTKIPIFTRYPPAGSSPALPKRSLSERPSPVRTTAFVVVTSPPYVTTTTSGSITQKPRTKPPIFTRYPPAGTSPGVSTNATSGKNPPSPFTTPPVGVTSSPALTPSSRPVTTTRANTITATVSKAPSFTLFTTTGTVEGPSTISPQSPLLTPTAPEMDTSQSSVVLGAALGGVAFVLLAVVFVVVVIYRKKARSKGAGRNSSCLPCFQPRQGSPPTSNPNYYPPEILHGPRDQRLANATNNNAVNKGETASYYNTDLANHFYETVATIPRRSNNDDLPPIPTVDSQTNSSTAVSQNQDSAQNASGADQGYEIPKPHYLELVDDPDYYNRLGVAQPSPTAPPQDRGYAKLPFKSTNEYHVLEKEYTNTP